MKKLTFHLNDTDFIYWELEIRELNIQNTARWLDRKLWV